MLKDKMTDIISIPEDSSSNTTGSLDKINLHDKSSCTNLSIVQNRINNENNCFHES